MRRSTASRQDHCAAGTPLTLAPTPRQTDMPRVHLDVGQVDVRHADVGHDLFDRVEVWHLGVDVHRHARDAEVIEGSSWIGAELGWMCGELVGKAARVTATPAAAAARMVQRWMRLSCMAVSFRRGRAGAPARDDGRLGLLAPVLEVDHGLTDAVQVGFHVRVGIEVILHVLTHCIAFLPLSPVKNSLTSGWVNR